MLLWTLNDKNLFDFLSSSSLAFKLPWSCYVVLISGLPCFAYGAFNHHLQDKNEDPNFNEVRATSMYPNDNKEKDLPILVCAILLLPLFSVFYFYCVGYWLSWGAMMYWLLCNSGFCIFNGLVVWWIGLYYVSNYGYGKRVNGMGLLWCWLIWWWQQRLEMVTQNWRGAWLRYWWWNLCLPWKERFGLNGKGWVLWYL